MDYNIIRIGFDSPYNIVDIDFKKDKNQIANQPDDKDNIFEKLIDFFSTKKV